MVRYERFEGTMSQRITQGHDATKLASARFASVKCVSGTIVMKNQNLRPVSSWRTKD